jgi:hypothetical protein
VSILPKQATISERAIANSGNNGKVKEAAYMRYLSYVRLEKTVLITTAM